MSNKTPPAAPEATWLRDVIDAARKEVAWPRSDYAEREIARIRGSGR